jgi:lysophospholipase L1-like esterase
MSKEKIYFWPQWFAASLPLRDRQKIKPILIKNLGWANLYLWRALNIYDDFLDGAGRPEFLPVANSYHRRYLEIYYRLKLPAKFYKLFNKINVGLDAANRREASRPRLKIKNGEIIFPSRLPNFRNLTNLSNKSLALGLGPVAIIAAGNGSASRIDATLNFFRSALAAKQLADDARDWLDDLQSGSLNPCNILVIQEAKKRGLVIDLKHQPAIAYLLFAAVAQKISEQLKQLCRQTRTAGGRIGLAPKSRLLQEILAPIETGLSEAAQFLSGWQELNRN